MGRIASRKITGDASDPASHPNGYFQQGVVLDPPGLSHSVPVGSAPTAFNSDTQYSFSHDDLQRILATLLSKLTITITLSSPLTSITPLARRGSKVRYFFVPWLLNDMILASVALNVPPTAKFRFGRLVFDRQPLSLWQHSRYLPTST